MANPIILADNRFLDGVPSATDTEEGYDVLNIRDQKTYTSWRAASTGMKYLTVDCGPSKAADAIAIVKHNLGTAGAAVSVESSDNGSDWTERLGAFTPSNDKAILKMFASAAAQYWRVKIDALSVPEIAVCMVGSVITFPYPPDAPFKPVSVKTEAESIRSKTGVLLGTIVRFKPVTVSARFSGLPRSWVEDAYVPFYDEWGSNLIPFFWAWDLDYYPDDVHFLSFSDRHAHDPDVSLLSRYDLLQLEMEGVKE